jgi:pyrroline-5-carboxylate reductase
MELMRAMVTLQSRNCLCFARAHTFNSNLGKDLIARYTYARSIGMRRQDSKNIVTTSASNDSAGQEAGSSIIEGTKLGVIGYGKMSGALVGGFLNAGILNTADICASVRSPDRKTELIDMGLDKVFDDALHGGAESIAEESNVIMIGVKPQVIKPVLHALAPHLKPKHLIISIAAGITLAELEESLGHGVRVIRVMPNTPSLCQQGASAYALGAYAGEKDSAIVHELLSKVGVAIKVQEKMMDGVTGVSGSGPAYIYMMIEAMADGGVMAGLPRETAMILAAQTAKGAADMVLNGEGQGLIHPGVLKDQVASPAGATIAAIAALEDAGMRSAFIKAVLASAKRSEELG